MHMHNSIYLKQAGCGYRKFTFGEKEGENDQEGLWMGEFSGVINDIFYLVIYWLCSHYDMMHIKLYAYNFVLFCMSFVIQKKIISI